MQNKGDFCLFGKFFHEGLKQLLMTDINAYIEHSAL